MEEELLKQFDALDFVALRAGIPRSVATHRHEGVALLVTLLGARAALLGRLPRVEYLITMLSTEEADHRRNIVTTPLL
ncbi:MAG: hypothetical protein GY910_12730 [bacterium]|nr:hypothetical protein [Deltaproteobacteria bacterium]MCP4905834.1 hypothetical protein [bacterium]